MINGAVRVYIHMYVNVPIVNNRFELSFKIYVSLMGSHANKALPKTSQLLYRHILFRLNRFFIVFFFNIFIFSTHFYDAHILPY